MTSTQGGADFFINRPTAKAASIPWKDPPAPSNPVVRGTLLHYGGILISNLNFVQQLLWNNAGFSSLRDHPQLNNVESRYEPLVIKANRGAAAVSDEQYLKSLLDEAWDGRRPGSKVHLSVLDYHEAYKSGRITPTAVAKALLPLIDRDTKKSDERHSKAFLQVRQDLVLKAAEESTQRYKDGKFKSVLDGVPVAVKDEVDLAGYRKCYASKIDFTRKDDATTYCVQRWMNAGAVVIGKTTMQELGSDITGNNPTFGTPLNPNHDNYYCGGSSTGSAYAVAAGLTPLCEGNDGGGSIRIPATYCGVYGLKTSHGRVSKRPSTDLARSTGVAGPIAANMVDLEIGYQIMAQPDSLDPDSSLFTPPGSNTTRKSRMLGIYRPWFDRADPLVKISCQKAIDWLVSTQNYTLIDITLPLLPEGQLAHAMTILSELSIGIPEASTHLLSPANKVLIPVARKTTAVDFLQAQRLRNLIMQHLSHLYSQHPGLIIVSPTTAEAGWKIEKGDLSYGLTNANKQLKNMEYAWLANFCGCPAISVPVGYDKPTDGKGKVPIGFMGMGEWCSEDELIAFGYDCEKFLNEEVDGGRFRPGNHVDVLELAASGSP
ncbi:Fatty acid amide hydrolase [Pseudocercospora fuligena]|uniref:Fatty acid amide hydrolase n=1 Tax=Pseudocercospora fuligena TaxID=685502 RepID=A0A8H6VR91_9PEZI|nr:Fatty acid amide hydrolase [Pseudocercospora fuligena]